MTKDIFDKITDIGSQAQAVAYRIHRRVNLFTDYSGPVVTAGGFWRDRLLGRNPKDIDVFLRQARGAKLTLASIKEIAANVAESCGIPVFSFRPIPCYGEWADDIEWLVKVSPADESYPELDVIFLDREKYRHGDFLGHCLNRFDVRLNSIGADSTRYAANAHLPIDIDQKRLVVHLERMPMNERMKRRLVYLTTENKFPGWKPFVELDDAGSIIPYNPEDDTVTLDD